ncbi:tRNA (guanine) methyltransferase Trm5 like protein [Teratosphaeria destructans]|uniref:tRNA (guanine(37)-N1)-methyltransferase n=1 Tax=Teratosphaeria destructans TaxID=418781 RepID=A0A9W7SX98_9PEZI|nr:tRNA (guanine) methyltransferase Trm5 like protein [Teratosphaeria destructans]
MADDMFRAPIHRGMRVLDRSKFIKVIPLRAARVFNNKDISRIRSELEKSKDVLQQDRLANVHPDPDPELAKKGRRCILLRPELANASTNEHSMNGDAKSIPWPHSSTVIELVEKELISLIPYELKLHYDYWTYHDIMSAILPEDDQGEIPSGYNGVGHVAHLNLRDEYLKYKHLIAEILLDKNQGMKTVINKIDDVGEENEFRTFKYEVLAGPDDMNVTISEEDCIFKFDYSKVYWNSKLNTEHRRLVNMFEPGSVVCDVMAGIGPFAVPAGKKGSFVWANDLNPDSYTSLEDAIKRNKVSKYVRPSNKDGRIFIRTATAELAKTEHNVHIMSKPSKKGPAAEPQLLRTVTQPKTFSHFVMNLPATAITFLPSFIGLYTPAVRQNLPPNYPLPVIHVYCFSTKSDDNVFESQKISDVIGKLLHCEMKPGEIKDGGVAIYDVRDVAPKKRMFCASFRLPRSVAERDVQEREVLRAETAAWAPGALMRAAGTND